jgi:hypothetical protein
LSRRRDGGDSGWFFHNFLLAFRTKEEVMAQSPDSADRSMEGCVMLALSTFRKSEKVIDAAIEKARDVKS